MTVSMSAICPPGSIRKHDEPLTRGDPPMSDVFVPVILGTARPGRRSEAVARHVVDAIRRHGLASELIDVADYGLAGTGHPSDTGRLDAYGELIERADGLVIVAPEYNHGYPGELKLLLDSQGKAYARKPVGVVSVSAGLMGGARMVQQLRLVTTALRMVPVSPSVHVSEVGSALNEQGGFAEPSLQAVLEEMVDEIEWFARALAADRVPAG
jgi:NAD(P)H-dependent FMN reductase